MFSIRQTYILFAQTQPCISALKIIPVNVKNSIQEDNAVAIRVTELHNIYRNPCQLSPLFSIYIYMTNASIIKKIRKQTQKQHAMLLRCELFIFKCLAQQKSLANANGITISRMRVIMTKIVLQIAKDEVWSNVYHTSCRKRSSISIQNPNVVEKM